MKPIHVIHILPTSTGGGAEKLVARLIAGLGDDQISVEGFYFAGTPRGDHQPASVDRSINSPLNILDIRRLIEKRLSNHSGRLITHTHLTRPFYFNAIASSGLQVRRVHTEHNTTTRIHSVRQLNGIERLLYRRCQRVVAVSQGVRDMLHDQIGVDRSLVSLIHNGSDQSEFLQRPAVSGRPIQLISVGSLTPKKGFDRALNALAKTRDRNWTYTLIGEGPDRQKLHALCASLGIADRVRLPGWSDHLAPLYAKADLQIIPSRWEGFGLVAVEGMSSGLRIVASDLSGLREVVGTDDGIVRLVQNPDSIEAWVAALDEEFDHLRSVDSPSSGASHQRAALFSMDKCIEAHRQMYRSVAGL